MTPSLVTMPTPTLFADPSMPRAIFTSGIKTEGACGTLRVPFATDELH